MHAFYCGLSNDIRTLVGKRNDLSPIKIYEMEKANQQLEMRYESQQAYTSSCRFPRYESGAPQNRSQRGEWRDQRNDRSKQDSREQYNDKPILTIQTVGAGIE